VHLARESGTPFGPYSGDSAKSVAWIDTILGPMGQAAAPLPADHWYGAHGANTWVVPGKVSLVFPCPDTFCSYDAGHGVIHRLHARYRESLAMSIVTRTVGYIHSSAPLAPAAEADSIRSDWQDRLKLPVTVGVEETPFERLPDGRRINQPVPVSSEHGLYSNGPVLVDQHGLVVWRGSPRWREAELYAFIDRLLGRTAAQ
jgi:hypothetical protein